VVGSFLCTQAVLAQVAALFRVFADMRRHPAMAQILNKLSALETAYRLTALSCSSALRLPFGTTVRSSMARTLALGHIGR
jgi:hypothetical protein